VEGSGECESCDEFGVGLGYWLGMWRAVLERAVGGKYLREIRNYLENERVQERGRK
jgi:hypothetical protein